MPEFLSVQVRLGRTHSLKINLALLDIVAEEDKLEKLRIHGMTLSYMSKPAMHGPNSSGMIAESPVYAPLRTTMMSPLANQTIRFVGM